MKKLFLLLVGCSYFLPVFAQQVNQSIVRIHTGPAAEPTKKLIPRTSLAAQKTTVYMGEWFIINVACANAGIASPAVLFDTYPDSNIYYPSGSYYIPYHGLGVSFDPTSPYFSWAWSNTTITTPPSTVYTQGDPYIIDSIDIAGKYQRINTIYPDDTLYIDVTYTSDTGAWSISDSSAYLVALGIIQTPVNPGDTVWTFGNAYYNWSANSIDASNTAPVWRFTKILNGAAAIDTTPSGHNDWHFPQAGSPAVGSHPWPMHVPAGKKVVAYAHFASGHMYPLGTPNTACNLFKVYSEDFNVTPLQTYYTDQNTGLVASTDDRYHINYYSTKNIAGMGYAPILTGAYYYVTPVPIHHPWYGFHITSVSHAATSTISSISNVMVYPVPATDKLGISYSADQNISGTATLTNILGQVVATSKATNGHAELNVSSLPDGIYIYTLEINGQRVTGRVVVVH